MVSRKAAIAATISSLSRLLTRVLSRCICYVFRPSRTCVMFLAAITATSMLALYFSVQTMALLEQISGFKETQLHMESEVQALKILLRQRDAEIRNISSESYNRLVDVHRLRADIEGLRFVTARLQHESDIGKACQVSLHETSHEREVLRANLSSSDGSLHRLRADIKGLRFDAARLQHESDIGKACQVSLHGTSHEREVLRADLSSSDGSLRLCDSGRKSLAVELNASEEQAVTLHNHLLTYAGLVQDCASQLNTTAGKLEELETYAEHAASCCDAVPMCHLCVLRKDTADHVRDNPYR